MATKQISGDMFYKKAFPLVDYCGDIERGSGGYHADFSPNNIKRLIYSPSEIFIEYYVSAKGKKSNYMRLDAGLYNRVSEMEDYIPILNILSGKNICASIEEIVLIKYADNGAELSYKECNIEGLIRSYKGSGNPMERIKSRYVRLHDFCIVNQPCSVKQLLSIKTEFISDIEQLDKEVTYVHQDDWYKHFGTHSVYKFDEKGSSLRNYFEKIREIKERSKVEGKKKELKNSRLKKEIEEQKNYLDMYVPMYKNQCKIKNILLKAPSNLLKVTELPLIQVTLNQVDDLKETKTYKVQKSDKSDAEAIKENIEMLKKACVEIYDNILGLLLNNLSNVGKISPLALNLIMKDNSIHSIAVRNTACKELNSQIINCTGKSFDGKKVSNKALVNVCKLFAKVYLSDNIEHNIDAEKWAE